MLCMQFPVISTLLVTWCWICFSHLIFHFTSFFITSGLQHEIISRRKNSSLPSSLLTSRNCGGAGAASGLLPPSLRSDSLNCTESSVLIIKRLPRYFTAPAWSPGKHWRQVIHQYWQGLDYDTLLVGQACQPPALLTLEITNHHVAIIKVEFLLQILNTENKKNNFWKTFIWVPQNSTHQNQNNKRHSLSQKLSTQVFSNLSRPLSPPL